MCVYVCALLMAATIEKLGQARWGEGGGGEEEEGGGGAREKRENKLVVNSTAEPFCGLFC